MSEDSSRKRSAKLSVKLSVKIVPSSSRDTIAGWLGEDLKVRVTAAPERGKANLAVEKIIATALVVPQKSVHIV